jgi:hypothetical protein
LHDFRQALCVWFKKGKRGRNSPKKAEYQGFLQRGGGLRRLPPKRGRIEMVYPLPTADFNAANAALNGPLQAT